MVVCEISQNHLWTSDNNRWGTCHDKRDVEAGHGLMMPPLHAISPQHTLAKWFTPWLPLIIFLMCQTFCFFLFFTLHCNLLHLNNLSGHILAAFLWAIFFPVNCASSVLKVFTHLSLGCSARNISAACAIRVTCLCFTSYCKMRDLSDAIENPAGMLLSEHRSISVFFWNKCPQYGFYYLHLEDLMD